MRDVCNKIFKGFLGCASRPPQGEMQANLHKFLARGIPLAGRTPRSFRRAPTCITAPPTLLAWHNLRRPNALILNHVPYPTPSICILQSHTHAPQIHEAQRSSSNNITTTTGGDAFSGSDNFFPFLGFSFFPDSFGFAAFIFLSYYFLAFIIFLLLLHTK